MEIRGARAGDFDTIAAITTGYILRTAIHFGTQPVTGDELRAEWERTRERYACLVAVVDGAVAGFAKASSFRARAAYGWTAELGVYVDEAHHRAGIATALYKSLIAVCRAQGFHALVAGIVLPNDASVRLHEKLGFRAVGTFPEIGYKHGSFHDVGFWHLALAPADATPEPVRAPVVL